MLGIRLSEEAERRLARHAREAGRPKSVVARDWIMERLEREEVDEQIRRAAKLHAEHVTPEQRHAALAASDAYLRWLDAEDGGYDWGPQGPPPTR
jgi:predicted DNA-binding protein